MISPACWLLKYNHLCLMQCLPRWVEGALLMQCLPRWVEGALLMQCLPRWVEGALLQITATRSLADSRSNSWFECRRPQPAERRETKSLHAGLIDGTDWHPINYQWTTDLIRLAHLNTHAITPSSAINLHIGIIYSDKCISVWLYVINARCARDLLIRHGQHVMPTT